MTPIPGADISMWQWPKGIPLSMLPKLRRGGVKYVSCRASIGDRKDPSFVANVARLRKAGFLVGAYHFLDQTPVKRQWDTFKAQLDAVGASPLLPTLDVERGGQPTYDDAKAFADLFMAAYPGRDLILYTNRSTWASFGNPDLGERFDVLWQAYYSVRGQAAPVKLPPAPPHGFGGMPSQMWQWGPLLVTGKNKVIRLDGDAWYGTMAALEDHAVSKVKPPRERTPWIDGYNAAVKAQKDALIILKVPPNAGPFFAAGYSESLGDGYDAVSGLVVTP